MRIVYHFVYLLNNSERILYIIDKNENSAIKKLLDFIQDAKIILIGKEVLYNDSNCTSDNSLCITVEN